MSQGTRNVAPTTLAEGSSRQRLPRRNPQVARGVKYLDLVKSREVEQNMAATRFAGLGALAIVAGVAQLALAVWGVILLTRFVSAIERASDAYRDSVKKKE